MHICTYANKVFYSSHNDIIYLIKSHPVPSDTFCSLSTEISPLAMSDPYFELKINCQKKVFNWFHPTAFCTKSFYNTFKNTIYISQHLRLNLPSINIDWFSSIPQSSTVMDSSSSSVMIFNKRNNRNSIHASNT